MECHVSGETCPRMESERRWESRGELVVRDLAVGKGCLGPLGVCKR